MMKRAGHWISPCLLILLTGCATPEPIIRTETVEVIRDRYVKIPEGLTKDCVLVDLPETVDTLGLGAAYKQQRIRMMACNAQLAEIRALGEQ